MTFRQQVTEYAELIALLRLGESVEFPWSEALCAGINGADYIVSKGCGRFATASGSTPGTLRITRIQGGIF